MIIDERLIEPAITEKMEGMYKAKDAKLIKGIGYRQMGNIRKAIFLNCKAFGYFFMNYIHPAATIEKNVKLGVGNISMIEKGR